LVNTIGYDKTIISWFNPLFGVAIEKDKLNLFLILSYLPFFFCFEEIKMIYKPKDYPPDRRCTREESQNYFILPLFLILSYSPFVNFILSFWRINNLIVKPFHAYHYFLCSRPKLHYFFHRLIFFMSPSPPLSLFLNFFFHRFVHYFFPVFLFVWFITSSIHSLLLSSIDPCVLRL